MTEPEQPSAARRPFRPLAWLIAAVSLGLLVFAAYALARHAQSHNTENRRATFAFEQVTEPEFTFAGTPVNILPAEDIAEPTLRLTYGDDEVLLPESIESEYPNLPGLIPYEDWLKVFRFIEATGISKLEATERLLAGEERLVVVKRNLRPGADPQTWGQVWRSDWTFNFYELLPEGGFSQEQFDFPESQRSYERRVRSARSDGLPDPERNPRELQQGTWQFEVALQVMPPGAGPSMLYSTNALATAGWRLHLAVLSMLVFVISLLIAVAPKGRTKTDAV
ncbi:MAG: hypothetical protein AAF138_00425 [Planctomycetota bacterium]